MAISSNVDIQDNDYGFWVPQKNGDPEFVSFGKATLLDEVCEDIETGNIFFNLCCDYKGKIRRTSISRGELTDFSVIRTLSDKGFQIYRKSFEAFVDMLLLQEENLEEEGTQTTKIYSHLGWIEIPNDNGGFDLCYRADKLLGSQKGSYIGPYAVSPMGDYEVWKNMVESDVVGHPVLELVLIASLAAVVNGLIAPVTNGENAIVHLNYPSGKGKSSALMLGVSTSGEPFDGTDIKPDKNGEPKEYLSLYQSWGATDNAMIASQAGNRGVVTVLNELGKNLSRNMTRLVFDLSEGSDKKRLTPALNTRISQRYTTVFISSGESSLLEKCQAKLEGLNVRVMEISSPITDSAEHSNRIKEVCRKNNGFASPMLAQYIIDNGGIDYVLPLYRGWQNKLCEAMSNTPNKERFVEKFAALFMTTAEIASKALGIDFNIQSLQQFLIDYDNSSGNDRNVALQAYWKVLEECRIYAHCFYTPENLDNPPKGPVYGKVCRCKHKTFKGKTVDEEFLIRGSYLERVLKKYNFPNKDTCLRAWEEADLLSRDKDRATRSRQIAPGHPKEDVYVLLTFKDDKATTKKTIPLRTMLSQKDEHKTVDSLLIDEEGGIENDDSLVDSE